MDGGWTSITVSEIFLWHLIQHPEHEKLLKRLQKVVVIFKELGVEVRPGMTEGGDEGMTDDFTVPPGMEKVDSKKDVGYG